MNDFSNFLILLSLVVPLSILTYAGSSRVLAKMLQANRSKPLIFWALVIALLMPIIIVIGIAYVIT